MVQSTCCPYLQLFTTQFHGRHRPQFRLFLPSFIHSQAIPKNFTSHPLKLLFTHISYPISHLLFLLITDQDVKRRSLLLPSGYRPSVSVATIIPPSFTLWRLLMLIY